MDNCSFGPFKWSFKQHTLKRERKRTWRPAATMAETSKIFIVVAKLFSCSRNEGYECPASTRRQKIRELAKCSRNCCGNWPRWTCRNLWTDVLLLETAQTGLLQCLETQPGGRMWWHVHILILWKNFHQRSSRTGGSDRLGTDSLFFHLLSTGQTGSKQVLHGHQLPVTDDWRVPELFDMALHPMSKLKADVWETTMGDATAGPLTSFGTNWKSSKRTAETREENWDNPTFGPVGLGGQARRCTELGHDSHRPAAFTYRRVHCSHSSKWYW